MPPPITVYYPGAAGDIIQPRIATDVDRLIFVDLNVTHIPEWLTINKICFDILRIGGWVKQKEKVVPNEYVMKFIFKGKERTLWYYFGINAAKDIELPQIVKDGFDIYIENRLAGGYGNVDSGLALPTGINNWYFNHTVNKKINNVLPKAQSQTSPKAKKVNHETAIDKASPKRDNRSGSSSPISIQSESSEAAIDTLKSRLSDPYV